MRQTPTHIIAAAKQLAKQAPDFAPETLAEAYRTIGVKDETSTTRSAAA